MRDYLELGPVPFGESCAQLGEYNYSTKARDQCEKYRDMLKTRFPQWAQFDCNFMVKSFNHDFGRYFEVVLGFETRNERSTAFAFHVDENLPEHWSDTAQLGFEMPVESIND